MGRPRKNPYTFARHVDEDWDFYQTVNTAYNFVEDWCADFLRHHRGTLRHQTIVDATRSHDGAYPPFGDAQQALVSVGGESIYKLMWTGQDGPHAANKWCVIEHVNRILTA